MTIHLPLGFNIMFLI